MMNQIFNLNFATLARVSVLLLALIGSNIASAADHPTIMVSIKPFYNLCAKVMLSVGKPQLLLNNNASPHDYHLKPSDIKLIKSADLIVWGGPELEGYLQKPVTNNGTAKDLNLASIPGLKLLPIRSSTNWEQDAHDHDHDHNHDHAVNDPHFWLDPNNAIVIVQAIAKRLTEIDPPNAKIYAKNAQDFSQELMQKDPGWKQQLTAVKDQPFIVFHDAYQYFDRAFGLKAIGSISLNPEIPPSVYRVQELQSLLKHQHVRCIFSEPQFNAKIIETLTSGLSIYQGQLDPLGQDSDAGPKGYFTLIDKLVAALVRCGNPH